MPIRSLRAKESTQPAESGIQMETPDSAHALPGVFGGPLVVPSVVSWVVIPIDADGHVLGDRWDAVTVPGLQLHCCDGIEWLKHRFDFYRLDAAGDAESGDRIQRYRNAGSNGSGSRDPGSREAALVSESGGGRSIVVTSGDEVLPSPIAESSVRRPIIFIYCDPPYPLPTRRSNRPLYAHEMTIEQHKDLLRVLVRLPVFVMVSSYWSELYADMLKAWRSISFEATTRGGSTATEWLWMNYPEPDSLHDYRFLGDDKRQRERIRRKVTNWTKGLDRLPELERNAILHSITSR